MGFDYTLHESDRHNWRPEALKRELERRFPALRPVERSRFVMLSPLADLIASDCKRTTIRHSPNAVEFPIEATLPLFVVDNGEPHECARPSGEVRIGRVQYKRISELNEMDAADDGFRSRDDLLAAMHAFYGLLNPADYVSIFHFLPSKAAHRYKNGASQRFAATERVTPRVLKASAL